LQEGTLIMGKKKTGTGIWDEGDQRGINHQVWDAVGTGRGNVHSNGLKKRRGGGEKKVCKGHNS